MQVPEVQRAELLLNTQACPLGQVVPPAPQGMTVGFWQEDPPVIQAPEAQVDERSLRIQD